MPDEKGPESKPTPEELTRAIRGRLWEHEAAAGGPSWTNPEHRNVAADFHHFHGRWPKLIEGVELLLMILVLVGVTAAALLWHALFGPDKARLAIGTPAAAVTTTAPPATTTSSTTTSSTTTSSTTTTAATTTTTRPAPPPTQAPTVITTPGGTPIAGFDGTYEIGMTDVVGGSCFGDDEAATVTVFVRSDARVEFTSDELGSAVTADPVKDNYGYEVVFPGAQIRLDGEFIPNPPSGAGAGMGGYVEDVSPASACSGLYGSGGSYRPAASGLRLPRSIGKGRDAVHGRLRAPDRS